MRRAAAGERAREHAGADEDAHVIDAERRHRARLGGIADLVDLHEHGAQL